MSSFIENCKKECYDTYNCDKLTGYEQQICKERCDIMCYDLSKQVTPSSSTTNTPTTNSTINSSIVSPSLQQQIIQISTNSSPSAKISPSANSSPSAKISPSANSSPSSIDIVEQNIKKYLK